MEKLIITIKNKTKAHYLLSFLQQLDFVEVSSEKVDKLLTHKEYDFFSSAGLWKDRNIDAKELRSKAWKRSL